MSDLQSSKVTAKCVPNNKDKGVVSIQYEGAWTTARTNNRLGNRRIIYVVFIQAVVI